MTSRILPREEWHTLPDIGALPLPDGSRPVVVEHDGVIVGCHVLMPIWHVEGLWIAPDHRGRSSVARRLWARVQQEACAIGVKAVVTAAVDDRVCRLLAHVGASRVPGDAYLVPVKG